MVFNRVRASAFAVIVADVGVASRLFGNGASCYRQVFVVPTTVPFSIVFMRDLLQKSYSQGAMACWSGSDRGFESDCTLSVVVS